MVEFQCSSASRKFLNYTNRVKIVLCNISFSALQRAENSSIRRLKVGSYRMVGFSALQRAENSSMYADKAFVALRNNSFSALQRAENSSIRRMVVDSQRRGGRFSALQRAENSSINRTRVCRRREKVFQCSSASRKFLNRRRLRHRVARQQVSVLFSEPKIPQLRYSQSRN